jgi:hypothetical protein
LWRHKEQALQLAKCLGSHLSSFYTTALALIRNKANWNIHIVEHFFVWG